MKYLELVELIKGHKLSKEEVLLLIKETKLTSAESHNITTIYNFEYVL